MILTPNLDPPPPPPPPKQKKINIIIDINIENLIFIAKTLQTRRGGFWTHVGDEVEGQLEVFVQISLSDSPRMQTGKQLLGKLWTRQPPPTTTLVWKTGSQFKSPKMLNLWKKQFHTFRFCISSLDTICLPIPRTARNN